jgi:hypothetical protein
LLADAGSPAGAEADQAFAAIVAHGVEPALALAVFQHESGFGLKGSAVRHRNWGNLRRSPDFPSDGGFVTYPDWTAAAGDAARLLAVYGRNAIRPGTRTDSALTFPHVWAPSADGNDPDAYGLAIVGAIRRFVAFDGQLAPGGPAHPAPPAPQQPVPQQPTQPPPAQPGPVEPAPGGPAPTQVPPRPAPPQPPIPDGTVVIYAADFDGTRIRATATLDATVLQTVERGTLITVRAVVTGDAYTAVGLAGNEWLEIAGVGGQAQASPSFSAAVLWHRT